MFTSLPSVILKIKEYQSLKEQQQPKEKAAS